MSALTESRTASDPSHGRGSRAQADTWILISAWLGILAVELLLFGLYDSQNTLRMVVPGHGLQPMAPLVFAVLPAELVLSAPVLLVVRRLWPPALLPCALAATILFGLVDQAPVFLTLLLYFFGHLG